MNKSQYFTEKELACRCGCGKGMQDMEQSFLNRLDMLRTSFGGPLVITSGYRCKKYNEKIKGSKNSQHTFGRAVDVAVAESDKRWKLVANALALGLSCGLDGAFCHVDSREGPKLLWLYPVNGE